MQEVKPQLKLYRNINSLPFLIFIDIFETKDFSKLLICGEASKEELEQTWAAIEAEYYDAINDGKDNQEAKDLTIEYRRICRARKLIDSIAIIGAREALIDELYSFDYPLPEKTGTNTTQIVNLFVANHKRDYVDLQVNTKDRQESQNDAPVINAAYFMETIAILMANLKCNIDINTLTLGLYVALLKQNNNLSKKQSNG